MTEPKRCRPHPSDWRIKADERLHWLEWELKELTDGDGGAAEALARAYMIIHEPEKRRLRDRIAAWWSGCDIECAWRNLHDAEARIIARKHSLAGELPAVRARIAKHLSLENNRWIALDKIKADEPTAADRTVLEHALRVAFEESHDKHSTIRGHRNKLFIAALILLVLTMTMGVITSFHPRMLSLCSGTVCPTGGGAATGGDVWLVLLLGAIGAAVAAVQSLLQLRQSLTPYTLSGYLAAVKILLGAVLAVIGVVVLKTGVGGTVLEHTQEVLVLAAVVLGYSQQLGTRALDNYARQIMAQARPNAGGP